MDNQWSYEEWLDVDYDNRHMIDEETWYDIWMNGYEEGFRVGEKQ